MYDAERADARALDQLEGVLREVAEDLATWRARALKAESDLKARGGGGSRGEGATDGHHAVELEMENRQLRARVEAARGRVQDLLSRLAFLEEQSREVSGSGGASGGGAAR